MTLYSVINPLMNFGEWLAGRQTPVPKKDGALRLGILGAANIALSAIVIPARSHAEVIIAAVAARDKNRAEEYARNYDIPIVHDNYDTLIEDPAIDCVYIPLPNGLHYPWALKALEAGKHVLLEKPSVSNAEEARSLFRHSAATGPNAPVLVEASHYRFHPAWSKFLSLIDAKDIEEVDVRAALPRGFIPENDIRFKYPLAGGACMDIGHYAISCMRGIFRAEPELISSAKPRLVSQGYDQDCDMAMEAIYEFPNGGLGKVSFDLGSRGGYWFPWLTSNWPAIRDMPPWVSVRMKEERGSRGTDGRQRSTERTITMINFMGPHIWHRIDVVTAEIWRDSNGTIVESSKKTESHKAYTWPEGVAGQSKGEQWWPTYRYQLEEFVNRVKGRKGSGAWVDGEESIKQMEVTDKTYEKAGMLVRPTCKDVDGSK